MQWWPLLVIVAVGLVAMFVLPQPWQQLVITIVFFGELGAIQLATAQRVRAEQAHRRAVERMLAETHRALAVVRDHYAALLNEFRKTDPKGANEAAAALNADLAFGSALHRKDRDDG